MTNIIISTVISALMIAGALWYDTYGGGAATFGATSFPTSLDSFTNPAAGDRTNSPSHADQHSNANDAVEALQAKVGIDGSAVTSSHDYKLSGVTGSDVAASLTGTETLTNKTLTNPTITDLQGTISAVIASTTLTGTTTINSSGLPVTFNLGTDATGDIFYRNASGYFTRLPIGTAGQFLQVSSGLPSWQTSQANAPTVTTNATSTASTTAALSVDGATQVDVIAYGSAIGDNTSGDITFQLDYGGVVVDEYVIDNPGAGAAESFFLTWNDTPSATTTTLTVTQDKTGSIVDSTIVIKTY